MLKLRFLLDYIVYASLFTLIAIIVPGFLSLADTMREPAATDSVSEITPVEETEVFFPCPDGAQCFENYTAADYPFDALISKLLSKNEQVRIAWFGDSFCEADILVGDLRDTLQSLYGGNGVGFLPIAYNAPSSRLTVWHSFDGWHTSSLITDPNSTELGIAGTVHKPGSGAFVTYEGTDSEIYKRKAKKAAPYKHTEKFNTVRLFYASKKNSSLKIRLNDEAAQDYSLEATQLPKAIVARAPDIQKVAITIPAAGGVAMYGASLEDETGIYFDNFSLRGNSGLALLSIREDVFKQFNDLLGYDLIVLQFGLNAVQANKTDYANYAARMTKVIERLKNAFPQTPILILSISDHSHQQQGKYTTMPGVPALLSAQRQLAIDNQAIFWNLFEAMGGMNSMLAYVEANPPLAKKDYLHVNFEGGKKLALQFAASFIHEVEFYKKRREQNK